MPYGTRAFFYPYSLGTDLNERLRSLGTGLHEWPIYSLGKAGTWGHSFSVGSLGRSLELQRAMSDEAKRIILSFEV